MSDPERTHDELGAGYRFTAALLDRVADDGQAADLYEVPVSLPDGRTVPLGDITSSQAAAIRRHAAARQVTR